jgi:hypothetical protein
LQGWERLNFLWPMHWVLGFNAKKTFIVANKTMVLFQHSAHGHWHTLGPFPYNLNLFAIKPNKTGFCSTLYDWVFYYYYEKPNCKKLHGASLGWLCRRGGPHIRSGLHMYKKIGCITGKHSQNGSASAVVVCPSCSCHLEACSYIHG